MNLVNYLAGLFRGHQANGELESVRDAARQDAQLMVGTYVQEFESEAARILTERQQRFIGLIGEDDEIIDVQPVAVAVESPEPTPAKPAKKAAAKKKPTARKRGSAKA